MKRLTNKELIIGCLADDFEDDIRIQRLLALSGEDFTIERIRNILNEMLDDGLIFINWSISNKNDGFWYGMTEKGIEFWNRIPDDERMTDFIE